jgi:ATP-dependent DNA helicase RecQ
MLAGRDVMAVLPTGAGKSVCFQLPALMRPGLTFVVSPLISLMQDQVAALRRRGLAAARLDSTTSTDGRRKIRRYLQDGGLSMLYVSPERLVGPELRALANGARLTRIVVDEAHCISEWGHDFRPSYRRIRDFAEAVGRPPIAAFTATATPPTRDDIRHCLDLRRPSCVTCSVDRRNLRWRALRVSDRTSAFEAAADEARSVLRSDPTGAVILYASTRAGTVRAAERLRRLGVRACPYHAGLPPAFRRSVQQSFLIGDIRVVCATSAFGMGIDHPRVRLVCHVGVPGALEAYVQEAGRAGRDGRPAACLLLATPTDRETHLALIRRQWPDWRSVRDAWRTLPAGRAWDPTPQRPAAEDDPREAAIRILLQLGCVREGVRGSLERIHPPAVGILRAHVTRGKRRARRRLASMLRYVETSDCRRAAIARYFGEPSPRCTGCDRCAGTGQR